MFRKIVFSLLLTGLFLTPNANAEDKENMIYLDLKDGRVVIDLFEDKAPNHVKRIKELVRQGFYDGVYWHRVIDGFMAQTGDPTGTGAGGSGQKLKAEFNDVKHVRGIVSMARAGHPDSADSQWFITFAPAQHLDGQYTAWGRVVEGMEYVDKIKRGVPGSGKVSNPDKVLKMQVAADVKEDGKAEMKKDAAEEKAKDMKEEAKDTMKKEASEEKKMDKN